MNRRFKQKILYRISIALYWDNGNIHKPLFQNIWTFNQAAIPFEAFHCTNLQWSTLVDSRNIFAKVVGWHLQRLLMLEIKKL